MPCKKLTNVKRFQLHKYQIQSSRVNYYIIAIQFTLSCQHPQIQADTSISRPHRHMNNFVA